MMSGRHFLRSCRPSSNVRAHFGFAPHQMSAVLQARTDKAVYFIKPYTLPILPSHKVWQVIATAPAASADKLSRSPPAKVELPDIKWTAAPLPEIKDVTEEPASLKVFTHSSSKYVLTPIGVKAFANTNEDPALVPHPGNNLNAIEDVPQTRHKPQKVNEYVALLGVKMLRFGFNLLSGYRGPGGTMSVHDWLNRCLFLKTVTSVSRMVAVMARHLRSLRSLQSDYGWIPTLLDEVENERMHLLIFMDMKQPGWAFQWTVLAAQGVFFPAFFLAYMVSPKVYHRFGDFLEEEVVRTYKYLLEDMEHGHLDEWCTMTAPLISRSYYSLPDDAKVYDMIKCIRADEADRRDVSHAFARLAHSRRERFD